MKPTALVLVVTLALAGCGGDIKTAQFGDFTVKSIPKYQMDWQPAPNGHAATSALTRKQFEALTGVTSEFGRKNPDSIVYLNISDAEPKSWARNEPHVFVDAYAGLGRYRSANPNVVSQGAELRLPAPYGGSVTCPPGALEATSTPVCYMEFSSGGVTHSISLPTESLPRWKQVVDGYIGAVNPLVTKKT